jgi:hypothetical protein
MGSRITKPEKPGGTPRERTETAYLAERSRVSKSNAEKTARLKGLRLAKEAHEREMVASSPPPTAKRTKPRKESAP